MSAIGRGGRGAVALALLLASASACAPLGGILADGYGPGNGATLDGDVRSVDDRRGLLRVRSYEGRTHTVRWERGTRVRWDGRDYPVTALERGDPVRVWVDYDRRGEPWARRVEVLAARGGQPGYGSRVERLEGTVTALDPRRGRFTVQPPRGARVTVYVGPRPDRDDLRRLERLRRGDRVRLDVRPVGARDAELVRFR